MSERSKTSISRLLAWASVVAGPDQLDDLVDVEDRDEQTLDEVQALLRLRAAEAAPSAYDVVAMVEVDLEHLLEAQRARLPVDERDGVDPERVLHRRLAVELLEDRLRVEAVLDLDDQLQTLVAVGQVLDVGDALQLLGLDQLLDPLDHPLGADVVGQLGDHDALAPRRDVLDPHAGPHPERSSAGLVGLPDPVQSDDLAAGRQVGSGHEPHQVVERRLRVVDQVAQRLHDLDQVVRGQVGRHTDRDPATRR